MTERWKGWLGVAFLVGVIAVLPRPSFGQTEEGEKIVLSERVGVDIDQDERERFGLFPGVEGFHSTVVFKLPDGRYLFKISYLDSATSELKTKEIYETEERVALIRQNIETLEVALKEKASRPKSPLIKARRTDDVEMALTTGEIVRGKIVGLEGDNVVFVSSPYWNVEPRPINVDQIYSIRVGRNGEAWPLVGAMHGVLFGFGAGYLLGSMGDHPYREDYAEAKDNAIEFGLCCAGGGACLGLLVGQQWYSSHGNKNYGFHGVPTAEKIYTLRHIIRAR